MVDLSFKRKTFFQFIILVCFIVFVYDANGNIRLPAIISSNMVLQQQSAVKIWGWGDPTEKIVITTSWNGKIDSTMADENANFQFSIETPSAGGPFTITLKGNNTIVLENVLIGEVWVCSGQSNMEMNYYWGIPQMNEDIPFANNSNIRFFTIPRSTAEYPQQTGEGSWVQSDSNSVKSFSAVGYYFGKKINTALNVPVGLINASWGGTPAETWTPAEKIYSDNTLNEAAHKLQPSKGWPITPGFTFNSMIAPVTNYSVAGTIWYQGESNTGTASTYQQLLTTMIKAWRNKWQKEFPFYYVQLAPFNYGNNQIGALLREAQTRTLSLSKTGMAVITDLADDTTDIHPKNKRDVGYRLANLALADHYKKQIEFYKSPQFKNMEIHGSTIHLFFDADETDFEIRDKQVKGLYIAGADMIFYPAQVKFMNDKMIVSHKKIKAPVAVRYAFSNTAIGNIFNVAGLPLAPFRTDNWDDILTPGN